MNLRDYYDRWLIRRYLAGKLSARQQKQLYKRRARDKKFAVKLLVAEVLQEPPPLVNSGWSLLIKIAVIVCTLAALLYAALNYWLLS